MVTLIIPNIRSKQMKVIDIESCHSYEIWQHGLVPGFNFIQLRLHWIGLVTAGLPPKAYIKQDTLTVKLFLVGLSAPMVQVGKDITWQDSLILENEVTVLTIPRHKLSTIGEPFLDFHSTADYGLVSFITLHGTAPGLHHICNISVWLTSFSLQ